MAIDPFAPSDDEPDTETVEEPKKETKTVAVNEMNEGKITLTFKGGAGFDAPWIVVHATDLDDALAQVSDDNATKLSSLMEKVSKAGAHFASKGGGGKSGGSGKPAHQEPPADAPEKPGDGWTFKSGVSKSGKAWRAWMPPRDSDEKPVWF